ncbi:hypothetical protein [Paenibacillus glycanilyticus]|uniref:Uncharacterized protein n=1 Tax=Paenibacillus glycanilyticus TaxID=126569 RepID=A0ABQ6GHE0_9BACL|nr:hypothetical protein [Paenibacillus glycanilyticus]GLX68748.1 hypothetical protein MU1_30930 [Paenibacillus glycanilyticus]
MKLEMISTMIDDKLDKRKIRRLKRRAASRANYISVQLAPEEGAVIMDAIFTHVKENRHKPRMKLCMVSRDQGRTWTEEWVDGAVTDPQLSVLKPGDLVRDKEKEFTYEVVTNEGERKITGPFQDDPNSPFYLPEGHLFRIALPLD